MKLKKIVWKKSEEKEPEIHSDGSYWGGEEGYIGRRRVAVCYTRIKEKKVYMEGHINPLGPRMVFKAPTIEKVKIKLEAGVKKYVEEFISIFKA